MKIRVLLLVGFVLLAVQSLAQTTPTLNYQGVITSNGTNYNGTGYFKFALENGEDASDRFWSNDDTPGVAVEPEGAVSLYVDHGLFHTELGDTNEDMVALSPLIFHQPHEFWLHIWFSATTNSPFTKLAPAVQIKPASLNTINTGNLIVVDPNGSADFQEIQPAIDYAEGRGVVILLMPGFYELSAPLEFPNGSYFTLMGVMKDRVAIQNTNGAAMVLGKDLTIRSISLTGDPAVTDDGAESGFEVDMFGCSLNGYGAGCAVELSGTGEANFVECEIETGNSGAYAMRLRDSSTSSEFKDCEVYGSVEITNLQADIEFTDCQLYAGELSPAVAVTVQNSGMDSFVDFRRCRLIGSAAPALSLSADADRDAEASLIGCELFTFGSNDMYTIVLDNAATNDVEDVSLMIQSSEVSGWESRGAVSVSHAELEVNNSTLEGEDYGVRVEEGGWLEMIHSQVEGDVAGIRAIGPATVELEMSTANAGEEEEGGGVGIWAEGDVFVLLFNSSVNGDGSGTNAVGLRLEADGSSAPYAMLSGAVVFGEHRGLEAVGGSGLKAAGSTFISITNIPAELREQDGQPNAQFTSSVFMRLDNAAKPAVLLSGSNPAIPLIANCQIEAPGHNACFGPSGATILMLNSVLSTNVGSGITLAAPASVLTNGNYILP